MSECTEWLWLRTPLGYGRMVYEGRPCLAHRAAFCQCYGRTLESIKGFLVRHTCDNPGCVNPDHLLLGSNQENMDDKVARGRQHKPKGVLNGNVKLTIEQVRYVRSQRGVQSQSTLAKGLGVTQVLISQIQLGKVWKEEKSV